MKLRHVISSCATRLEGSPLSAKFQGKWDWWKCMYVRWYTRMSQQSTVCIECLKLFSWIVTWLLSSTMPQPTKKGNEAWNVAVQNRRSKVDLLLLMLLFSSSFNNAVWDSSMQRDFHRLNGTFLPCFRRVRRCVYFVKMRTSFVKPKKKTGNKILTKSTSLRGLKRWIFKGNEESLLGFGIQKIETFRLTSFYVALTGFSRLVVYVCFSMNVYIWTNSRHLSIPKCEGGRSENKHRKKGGKS